MANIGGKYFIQDELDTVAPHHASFKTLWETKWKQPCAMGVYPFMFGAIQDFEPVAADIIKKGLKEPYDWDEYAKCFFPKAEELVKQAVAAENDGQREKASELYLLVTTCACISAFVLMLHEFPMIQVDIPHTNRIEGEGQVLPGFYHLPAEASNSHRVPLVIIFTGLDGYRTELAVWKEGWRQVGCATLIVEIPGTGDNPGAPSDPTSPDRVWDSMFEWIAKQDAIDQAQIVNWGFSTGGYYSIRLAHTHAKKLKGVVAHGGGCHYMFSPEWLEHADTREYPFDLAHTLCHKFGYGTDFERFKKEAINRYSLLYDGTLDKSCTKLLLVNGMNDGIFPIDDYYLCLQHGGPKEARFVPNEEHMGEPQSFFIILNWLAKLLDFKIDTGRFMSTIPSKPKF
ncbi:hypothetical protein JX266_006416 [Neoarthrinium moseri]|nr:hypothetical protein JX266_006416 [Neoarthrinium moseri]